MDPAPIGTQQWSEIGQLLTNLWLVVVCVVVLASSMLIGHNAIPSLVASDHVPYSLQKTRPAFYLVAIVSFGASVFFVTRVIGKAEVLSQFWPYYWI